MPTDTLYIASSYGAGPAKKPSHIDEAMLLDNDGLLGRLGARKRVCTHALARSIRNCMMTQQLWSDQSDFLMHACRHAYVTRSCTLTAYILPAASFHLYILEQPCVMNVCTPCALSALLQVFEKGNTINFLIHVRMPGNLSTSRNWLANQPCGTSLKCMHALQASQCVMRVQQLERKCVGKTTFPHPLNHGLLPAAGISSTSQHASALHCSNPLKENIFF